MLTGVLIALLSNALFAAMGPRDLVLLRQRRSELEDRRAELLRHYGIQSVVTNTFEYVTGAIYPLALALADSPDWQLVFTDSHSLVFVKADRPDPAAVSAKLQRVLDHMDIECSDYIEHDPRFPACARRMAQYWLEGRNRQRAYRMLSLYLSHARDAEAERVFQQLLQAGR